MSTIVMRGPFTPEQQRALVALVSDMEAARPEEIFEVYIDDPGCDETLNDMLAKLAPLRSGYQRQTKVWKR
jgi:TusA-related sulfurtransferase